MRTDERRAQARVVGLSNRGRRHTESRRSQRSETNAARQRFISPWERELNTLLQARGIAADAQQPVGRYNIDLAVRPVAVEVHRARWYPTHHLRDRQRIVYLLDRGWRSLYVWIDPRTNLLVPTCADQVRELIKLAQGNPAAFGEYRVIRGSGKGAPRRRVDRDELADVRGAERCLDTNRADLSFGDETVVDLTRSGG